MIGVGYDDACIWRILGMYFISGLKRSRDLIIAFRMTSNRRAWNEIVHAIKETRVIGKLSRPLAKAIL